tara:strand:+ start:685 stop:2730 length:2046 start_codon:yes stop_codon:yes gene_type:complete
VTKNNYTSDQITVLEGLEAVRKRPAMYIGDTAESGLHHLVWEVVDNSIDEAMAGECDEISVTLLEDGSCQVRDNGRGIPVDMHKGKKVPAIELVLGTLHAGGKFDDKTYKVSGGLHGVGVSCVNALAERLQANVYRDGKEYEIHYSRGLLTQPLKTVGKTKQRGTLITFFPDDKVFKEGIIFNTKTLRRRLKELAYLNPGLKIKLEDQRDVEVFKEEFLFKGGIREYIDDLTENDTTLLMQPFFCTNEVKVKNGPTVHVELALQFLTQKRGETLSFVNNIRTQGGGTHVTGLNTGVTRTLMRYMKDYKLEDKDVSVDGESIRYGMQAIVTVRLHEPQFEGQTKGKLGSTVAKGAVHSTVSGAFYRWLEQNPQESRKIVLLALTIAKASQRAKKAFDLERSKENLASGILPGKLTDCISKDRTRTELFIVEGDSAGGNSKQARDPHFQAVLPLRGKILNVEKAVTESRWLNNEEIKALIQAIGIGFTPRTEYMNDEDFEKEFPDPEMQEGAKTVRRIFPLSERESIAQAGANLQKLRYNKIIFMTDADVDGAHIKTLLLTFFYRHMPSLIENGHVYSARPPLYKVRAGKDEKYVIDEREKEALVEKWEGRNPTIMRFKGLGEMDADELWETTMDPENRILERIKVEDVVEAEKTFTALMGKDVSERKVFIQNNATKAMNLDV